jgi:hypothetical protein
MTLDPAVPSFTTRVLTDADGHFDMPDVIPGAYELTVNDPADASAAPAFGEWTVDSVVLSAGQPPQEQTIELADNGAVSGNGAGGSTPVAGSVVRASIAAADGQQYSRGGWITSDVVGPFKGVSGLVRLVGIRF